jgi:hypothetical protein
MCVWINKARTDHLTISFDHLTRITVDIAYGRDTTVFDRYISLIRRLTTAIDNSATFYHCIVHAQPLLTLYGLFLL